MAPGDNSFRTRAASLLHPIQALSGAQGANGPLTTLGFKTEPTLNEKISIEASQSTLEKVTTQTSGSKTYRPFSENAAAHDDREAQKIVRTVPSE